jgi:anaerobic selenocysteine-containing dehydrogenase
MAGLGEILTGAAPDPPIDALVVHNSNPAVIVPDQNRVVAGLARDDLFTVVVEQFMTDTARYADIVLPATTQIEHLDLGIAWGHLYLSLNRPAIDPVGEALPNTEIFRRLARAMGLDDPALLDSDEALVRQLLDSDHPWLDGVTYETLERDTWARLRVPARHRPYVDSRPATADARLRLGPIEHAVGFETPDGDERLAVSGDVQPGLVSIPFGWWHRHSPERRAVNALANPTVPSDGRGSAAFHESSDLAGVRGRVHRFADPVRAPLQCAFSREGTGSRRPMR